MSSTGRYWKRRHGNASIELVDGHHVVSDGADTVGKDVNGRLIVSPKNHIGTPIIDHTKGAGRHRKLLTDGIHGGHTKEEGVTMCAKPAVAKSSVFLVGSRRLLKGLVLFSMTGSRFLAGFCERPPQEAECEIHFYGCSNKCLIFCFETRNESKFNFLFISRQSMLKR